ncbi:URH1 Inosine-uridine nucleoside N-ribohydrolase [uncultured Caudovirales phage]|uniref:URH1 Inosine-uridine nucleoside N-ribohydrolase n=1 Tax=uncultured Caudovirales phage TaxID=2100421 RepID=A0A6J5RHV6_9CAUD|nr:URH1 Inosine-uridine nucleoside N-ribohydrolase [uncultured Caudovirales phage]
MINIAFDMETSDPDDVLTLCMLSHHPKVNLACVTVTPGSLHQIGLVKHILKLLDKNIPVGSKNKDHLKQCVSTFHYNWLGEIPPAMPDGTGSDILKSTLGKYPDLVIVCGASLGNIGALLDKEIFLNKIVIQGGFAGYNIVPEHLILEKFHGKLTCATFNLNGDVKAALKVLSSEDIINRVFVSKNVCHGVVYDHDMHEFVRQYKDNNLGLQLMFAGMEKYLEKNSNGKAFHDPLAACVAIDQNICKFEHVELYREKGEWGSRYSNYLNALISIDVDMDKFKNVMVGL